MTTRRVLRIVLIAALLFVGVWAFTQVTGVGPETAARQQAVRQILSPAGSQAAAEPAVERYDEPIMPVTVNLADVAPGEYVKTNQ